MSPDHAEQLMPNLIIGSRGSRLALWQSHQIKAELQQLHSELSVEIEIIRTTGDKLTEASLAQIGGKGVFTKEIEEALLAGRVDLAVHSLKDLPTTLPEGLHVAAITAREDVRDALIVRPDLATRIRSLKYLPQGARVGTSSLRRAAQLRHLRPDLQILELRGNVETRLRKLDEGEYEAIILASAGLIRLGLADRITERIPTDVLLPAVGQGALGIETRVADSRTNYLVEPLNHWPTRHATQGERALLRALGGGCAVPIAARGYLESEATDDSGESFVLEALVTDIEGRESVYDVIVGSPFRSEELGEKLAEKLLAAGASRILADILPESAHPAGENGTTGAAARSRSASADYSEDENLSLRTVSQEAVFPEAVWKNSLSQRPIRETGQARDVLRAVMAADESGIRAMPLSDSSAPEPATAIAEPDSVPPTGLAGRRIIVTRAARQAGELTRLLTSHGADVIACPTIEIHDPSSWESMDRALSRLAQYHWLAFTSTNGVDYFLRRFYEKGHDRIELAALKICAVGKKTAERLLDEGLAVDLMPQRFTADSLIEAFVRRFGAETGLKGSRMLLPASRTTRDVIRPALTPLGVSVEVIEAYQTVLPDNSERITQLLTSVAADYIIFTSPSTVANLAALLETDNLTTWFTSTRIACIGPITAESAQMYGLTAQVLPEEHTSKGLVRALLDDVAFCLAAGKG